MGVRKGGFRGVEKGVFRGTKRGFFKSAAGSGGFTRVSWLGYAEKLAGLRACFWSGGRLVRGVLDEGRGLIRTQGAEGAEGRGRFGERLWKGLRQG